MRLDVDTGAYASALGLMLDANRGVTDVVADLAVALDGCAAMSGTDSGGRAWADGYDDVAGRLVRAAADLGGSLGTMADLLDASRANHVGAEVSARLAPSAVTGRHGERGAGSERVSPARLPSAYGGIGGEPDGWHWLAAHLEGLLWPDADTGRMRLAVEAWSAAATQIDGWSTSAAGASYLLETQRSPEIHVAVAAARELGRHGADLAAACRDVAGGCRSYAEQVDEHHAQIVGVCKELLTWTAVDQVTGVVLSFVSGGGAELAAQLVESGVMGRFAARVVAILRRLIELARAAAAVMSRGLARVGQILTRLRTFLSVKVVRAVDEAVTFGLRSGREAVRRLLLESEHGAGHTLARHVGLTDAEMAGRPLRVVSTYTDEHAAEVAISRLLRHERAQVEAWLRSGSADDLELNGDAGRVIGRTLARGSSQSVPTTHLRIVIRRDPDMPHGYYIHTSYPTP